MKLVARFDFARLGKVQRTPQGFLRIPATLGRSGVQLYRRADGTTVRELRPDDEVFSEAHMASLAGAPVTRDHPPGFVEPGNFKLLAIGWVGEKIERKDSLLSGTVTIADKAAIEDVLAGKLKDFSLGYKVRIDATAGEDPQYGPYDQVQRGLVANHAALGPAGWGRAGPSVGLRLDAGDAILDPTLTPEPDVDDSGKDTRTRADGVKGSTMKIKINGVTFDVDDKVAEALAQDQARADAQTKEMDTLQGRFDAQREKLAETEKKLAEATDTKRFDAAVEARVALIDKARKVLGADAEIKGTPRAIMEQALKHDKKDPPTFEGKSDDYVESRFDALIEDLPMKQANQSKRQARQDARDAQNPGTQASETDRYDSKAARKRMIEENRKAATLPLTVARDLK
jgi:hypothetical protein